MNRLISRRMLLSTAALGSAGIGFGLSASKAQAFSLEEPSRPLAEQYLAARSVCSGRGDASHSRMIADLRAQLAGAHVPAEQQQQIISGAICPFCGCPLG
ncbi:MAG: hypothetical protein U1E38_07375 [Rhodospirillales bacterium]